MKRGVAGRLRRRVWGGIVPIMVLLAQTAGWQVVDAAPRQLRMECLGGGAMMAEYVDRRGSASATLTVRFVRHTGSGALLPGSCRLHGRPMSGNAPTVLVYRAGGERIARLRISPTTEVTGVAGPHLGRLIESIQKGLPFTVWVTDSGRGWWEIRRVAP
ncbi:MAG: hypothetical protein Kow006_03010 [Gammaproteobacteria bacterium]